MKTSQSLCLRKDMVRFKLFCAELLLLVFIFMGNNFVFVGGISGNCDVRTIALDDLEKEIKQKCVLVAIPPVKESLMSTLSKLSCAFSHEPTVAVTELSNANNLNNTSKAALRFKWYDKCEDTEDDLAFFPKEIEDRTCLLPAPKQKIKAMLVTVKRTVDELAKFLNENCDTYVDVTNGITTAGHRRDYILKNLYKVPTKKEHLPIDTTHNPQLTIQEKCEEITPPTTDEFISTYLFRSKPVIIKNGIKHWDAISKWTNSYLKKLYGSKEIHVKLTPDGEFEGCDLSERFENYKSFKIPDTVKSKLAFPELVVVRPATMNMPFTKFVDMVENWHNISAYLEYTSILGNFKELQHDVKEPNVLRDVLKLQDLNVWLSNGHTLGKLHFDPYDNLLCQLKGSKEAILFEPHNNNNLYEAHIQEAVLKYDSHRGVFRHHKLVDSTSMVMSPVNILKPDYQKFPNYVHARPINCTISEGDILYIPAFWWHEVQSYPSSTEKRNLAVNYWYKPFLTKSFPCPNCKLDINRPYRQLLNLYEP